MKKTSITLGTLLILLSLITIVPNALVGRDGLIRTDLIHNLINFFSGVALVVTALAYQGYTLKVMRIIGLFYIAFAILGALSVGSSEYDKVLGLIAVNGFGHLLHLAIGVILLTIGTRELRA